MFPPFLVILASLWVPHTVFGDGNDWVNVDYVLEEAHQAATSSDSPTYQAVNSIVRGADRLLRKGPWAVASDKGFLPPSKDARDYLSWAPYHWPDCRWCSKSGRNQLAHTGEGSTNASSTAFDSPDPSDFPDDDMLYEESVDSEERGLRDLHLAYHRGALQLHKRSHNRRAQSAFNLVDVSVPTNVASSLLASITVPAVPINPVGTSSTDSTTSKGTRPPAQAAAKTTKTTCTPSPTTSMAPSATWTTCRYIGRDGKVNPDVRGLNGPSAINSLSQYVLYGCISAVVNKDSKHAKEAVAAVDRFFLSPSTGMNPNLKYGQVVRGPGPAGISGTFTGILDLRGTVKIVNGLMLLRELAHPDWTDKRDSAMRSWLSQYRQWLTHSDIGKMTGSRPNNHGTFYVSQLAAAKIFEGSKEEAISILVQFFKKQFIDQIAASGEQPFEAVRTRPYHYRCFNIEALITNAKLGDQLGLDLWSSRSKYGATIQTAMDFIIASDPKGEKASEAVPHVAAVAAAYGDPKGKYAAFLKKHLSNYQSKPFWFYDQPRAVSRDSSKKMVKQSDASGNGQEADHDGASTGTPKSPNIPFTCPDVFKDATRVEIDNGIFVTCDELRPFYELPMPI